MARSHSSSTSHNDEDSSGSDSASESTASSSSNSESSSSSLSSALSSRINNNKNNVQQTTTKKSSCADAVAMERMERAQRLRRLLSQRKVGELTVIDDGKNIEPFIFRKGALDADDGELLSTFSNGILFSRLLYHIRHADTPARHQSFDELISNANPSFYRDFKLPLDENAEISTLVHTPTTHQSCAALEKSEIIIHRRKRERPVTSAAGHRRRGRDEITTAPRGVSTSGGIISKSLQSWEQHLSAQLQAEGVSLESFRQKRRDNNYLEEQRFLQESQWAEYQRELKLEEKMKEQKAKRAIRRGENTAD